MNDSEAQPDTATEIDGPSEPAIVPADDPVNDEPIEEAEERENRDKDTRNGRFLKPKEFYSYLLFERDVEENPVLYAERLAQQYLVDQFVKMEDFHLQYLLRYQEKLSAEE